jgi:hypothetical protein
MCVLSVSSVGSQIICSAQIFLFQCVTYGDFIKRASFIR